MTQTTKETKTSTETCWTCDDKVATHSVYRDALGCCEWTCDECHRNEYPEDYEEEEETAQVYLPANAFSNIMSYCDDRVEQNQRIHLAKCLAVLKHLKFLASKIYLDGDLRLDFGNLFLETAQLFLRDEDIAENLYFLYYVNEEEEEDDEEEFWTNEDEEEFWKSGKIYQKQ